MICAAHIRFLDYFKTCRREACLLAAFGIKLFLKVSVTTPEGGLVVSPPHRQTARPPSATPPATLQMIGFGTMAPMLTKIDRVVEFGHPSLALLTDRYRCSVLG